MQVVNRLEGDFHSELARDILRGLNSPEKSIPSKYFYDEYGSELFERICRLPGYYLTRTEMALLREHAPVITEGLGGGDLVELGSGANWKIRVLLDALDERRIGDTRYVPVDVSESALVSASEELMEVYNGLNVLGIIADFTRHMEVISTGRRKLVLFLGSTIGNLDRGESVGFMRSVAGAMEREDRFLIGIDMIKDREVLEGAYNDPAGVTEEFNKNLLRVVNRELNADLDPGDFEHLAFYSEARERIEMHLVANRALTARVENMDLDVSMEKGETIRTEISRKFSRESAEEMFARGGLEVTNWFSDSRGWFSLVELARRDA
jgi:L-histidine N-alpha-methyltransferase